ncbi:UNKNOWN [Stylonychia lemnae]|uniref:Uncharacterized protein n=1 Tax=Stylonychia lemnae TaxID=5949 RepID=A0A078B0Y9_STYLE|nr:UNKNOWN [Stylonychia lemnae]|eukprot:CDW87991.1 UNKNOWN [Stylonychia lemnae]
MVMLFMSFGYGDEIVPSEAVSVKEIMKSVIESLPVGKGGYSFSNFETVVYDQCGNSRSIVLNGDSSTLDQYDEDLNIVEEKKYLREPLFQTINDSCF